MFECKTPQQCGQATNFTELCQDCIDYYNAWSREVEDATPQAMIEAWELANEPPEDEDYYKAAAESDALDSEIAHLFNWEVDDA